ncbi:DUF58 domain-containing protein [Vallitalea pronyensis]|uniref:DUF58 domain-containing protein n=1 Tax=Vallitalea pronyensis TaxID=1348613 RepID=A0A8J8MMI3_9FIRM|nr:DUF58 domain-containing protein [Vallitalea pronyensis]QUI24271.1 DUF58 domain-containing protein [Vallitalea pronyensis]
MKRNRIYLITLIGVSILTYFIEGYILTTLFYMLLFIPVLSYLSIWLTYRRFYVTHEISKDKIVKGDTVQYTLTLYNETSLVFCPFRLKLSLDRILFQGQFESPTFILYPKSEEKIVIPLQCKYRGFYKVGIQSVIIEDYFGLFSKKIRTVDAIKMMVYPRVKRLIALPMSQVNMDEITNVSAKKQDEQNDISHMREYEKGDNLNKIHWKLSAKYKELMVKQYSGEVSNTVQIILDVNRHYLDEESNIAIEDKMVETVIMMTSYLLMHNKPVSLVFYDRQFVELSGKGYNDFERFYEECALLEFPRQYDFSQTVVDYYQSMDDHGMTHSHAYIITSNVDEALIDKMNILTIDKAKMTIMNIYMDQRDKNDKGIYRAIAEGYDLMNIPYERDLDTLIEGI